MKKMIMIWCAAMVAVAGCVSGIDIEHCTLEPCDVATTAEIAWLVEEGASKDGSKRIADHTLVALTVMIAESKPQETDSRRFRERNSLCCVAPLVE